MIESMVTASANNLVSLIKGEQPRSVARVGKLRRMRRPVEEIPRRHRHRRHRRRAQLAPDADGVPRGYETGAGDERDVAAGDPRPDEGRLDQRRARQLVGGVNLAGNAR